MKAVCFEKSLPVTDPEALLDIELPRPAPQGHDLLVEIKSISVNPVDTKIRQLQPPAPGERRILGWDASGVVAAVGGDATLFRPGDEVWYAGAINRPGTNAEFHLVDERIVGKKPESLSFDEAAALPLTSITAWEILFDRLKFTSESTGTLLVIGGAGGVGSIMIQLAKKLTQLTVIATASRPETQKWVRELGADHVIDHRQSLAAELQKISVTSVDAVASLTNTGQHLPAIVECIAPQGKLAVIDDPAVLDVKPFKTKSVSIHWELMFTRSLFQTPDMAEQGRLLSEVARLVDAGTLRSTATEIAGKIDAATLRKVHALIESGSARGKVVLAGF